MPRSGRPKTIGRSVSDPDRVCLMDALMDPDRVCPSIRDSPSIQPGLLHTRSVGLHRHHPSIHPLPLRLVSTAGLLTQLRHTRGAKVVAVQTGFPAEHYLLLAFLGISQLVAFIFDSLKGG